MTHEERDGTAEEIFRVDKFCFFVFNWREQHEGGEAISHHLCV